ncbi:MAG: hypothetical protein NEHIOOID_00957 [Holosporales bacterium]
MWIYMKKFTYIATLVSCLIGQEAAASAASYFSPVINPKDQSILSFFGPRLGFTKRSDWNNLTDVICEPDACSKDRQVVCYRGKRDPGIINGKKSCQQQQRDRLYKFIAPRVKSLSRNGLPIPGEVTATPSVTSRPSSGSPVRPNRPSATSSSSVSPVTNVTPALSSQTTPNGSFPSNVGVPDGANGSDAGAAAIAGGVIGAGALTALAAGDDNESPSSTTGSTNGNSINVPLPQPGSSGAQTLVPTSESTPGTPAPQIMGDGSSSMNTLNTPNSNGVPGTPSSNGIPSSNGVPGTPNTSSTKIKPAIPAPKKPSVAVCSVKGATVLRQNIDKAFESNPVKGNDSLVRTNEGNVFKTSLVAIMSHNNINVKKAKLRALYNSNEIYRDAMKKAYPQSVTNNIRTFTSCYLTLNDPQTFNAYLQAFLLAGKKKN